MYNYFLVFVTLCFSLNAQTKRVELQVKTDDKISIHGFSYWKEIKITSKDTSFIYSLHTKNPDIIPNLKQGNYTVTVNSVFNTQINKKVTLQKKSTLLKFTGLSTVYHQNTNGFKLSDKIKLHDTLYIVYSTTKDDINNEKLALTKTDDGFKVISYTGLTDTVFNFMMITPKQYSYVEQFEADLKSKNEPKAETALVKETYTIELNKEINTFIIPQNNNNGIEKLKAILFIVQR